MLTKNRISYFLAYAIGALLVWAIVGCGGGGSSAGAGGKVALTIEWPTEKATSRYLPTYAHSLVFTLTFSGPGAAPTTLTVNRPDTLPLIQTVEFGGPLAAGTYTLKGEAMTGANGAGDVVATATRSVVVQPVGLTTVSLTLASTLYSIDLLDMPLTMQIGDQAQQLQVQVLDKNKAQVFVPTSSLSWSILLGKSFISLDDSGVVQAVAAGTARVRVSEVGAGLYSVGDITVTSGAALKLGPSAVRRK